MEAAMGITRAQQQQQQQLAGRRERAARIDRVVPLETQRKNGSKSDICTANDLLVDEARVRKRNTTTAAAAYNNNDIDVLADCDDNNGARSSALQCSVDSDSAPPHAISRIAALNRELKALEVRYFRTRMQLEKSMDKNNQLRHDTTKLRGHATKLERETCKLRNLIDRIQGEKKQLELQAIHNRDYAKKIEQRFFMGSKGQSIIQCNVELGNQVKVLETRLHDKDAALDMDRRALQDAHEKLRILKRALETRFEAMELNGSLHTGILFELTRLQDESTSLALQLAHERSSVKALQSQLHDAQAKATKLDDALVVREAMLGSLERERVAVDDRLAALRNEKQTAAFEKATLLKFIQEQAEVKLGLDAQIKQLHATNATALAAVHTKLQASMDDRTALQDALRDASIACEQLRSENQRLDGALDDARRSKRDVDAQAQTLTTELEHARDAASKREDDYRAARDVCRELQSAVETYANETHALHTRVAELEGAQLDATQQLAAKQVEEHALRAAMENALRDLEMLSKQRNDAAKAMNEAVTISASSLDEQQALQCQLETQRKQLTQLQNAKSLLQNAMLEQLAALRKQLQLERVQRIEAEAKVKQLLAFSSLKRKSQRESATQALAQQPLPTGAMDAMDKLRSPTPATSITDCTVDVDAPQPLPPPMMANAPSLLPELLGTFRRFHDHTGFVSSSSLSDSSSSDDSSDDNTAEMQRSAANDDNVGRTTLSGVSGSPAHSPLLQSLELHDAEQVTDDDPLEAQISLLELAEED